MNPDLYRSDVDSIYKYKNKSDLKLIDDLKPELFL
jgi:hypothetical protein